MKILLATSNQGKVKEIKEFLKDYEVLALDEVMQPFEIIEDGKTFQENALIKAKAVFEKLNSEQKKEFVVMSDDSGISIEALNNEPGIFSARYSTEATDGSNRQKVISKLNELNCNQSPAFYTACIAIVSEFGEFNVHGFMNGVAINEERGENGFGYDFLFIPDGFKQTVGELSSKVKEKISHRTKALNLCKPILKSLKKHFKNAF